MAPLWEVEQSVICTLLFQPSLHSFTHYLFFSLLMCESFLILSSKLLEHSGEKVNQLLLISLKRR